MRRVLGILPGGPWKPHLLVLHRCIFPSYGKQADVCPREHSVEAVARGSGDLVIKGIFQLAVPWITSSGKPVAVP